MLAAVLADATGAADCMGAPPACFWPAEMHDKGMVRVFLMEVGHDSIIMTISLEHRSVMMGD